METLGQVFISRSGHTDRLSQSAKRGKLEEILPSSPRRRRRPKS